jgi:hypothetical protein
MSPPFPEQAIDRDCAPLRRGGQDFAGVCGRLHFFFLPATRLPPPGQKNVAPQEKKCPRPSTET